MLFDLDDTLLDYSGGVERCWAAACAAAGEGAGLDAGGLTAAVERARRWFWADPARHARERVDMLGAWTKIAAAALSALGHPDDTLASVLARDFASRRRAAMRLHADATPCLARFRAQGIPLALVTNGDATQQRDKIERNDLARFFDVILVEGEFGAGKPEEAVYRHVLEALGMTPADALMVGDHLEWDVGAPQRLGLTGVWMDRGGAGLPPGAAVRPHRIIRSLDELTGSGS